MHRFLKTALLLGVFLLSAAAHAEASFSSDPAAQATITVFSQVCLRNMLHPERVRDWAEAHHATEVTSPQGRAVFIGKGPDG